ncbi:MAG: hypothetical protein BM556_16110 [Bacteriovorax sp. MedPE-SWde]|mgnify:CR=1 FL=1|nr:MAG: hypothetical protein BM556_16110 [Bacteriovorax sp. MedPE-SWde]
MDLNLNFLKSFVELSKTLNFSKAAKNLSMAQPGLSRQIRQLEESLQTSLFLRDNKRVTLTQEGEYLRDHISPLLLGINDAVSSVKSLSDVVSGKITIACPLEIGEYLLAPLSSKFLEIHDEIEISLRFVSMDQALDMLLAGEADFGIGLDSPDQENIRSYKFLEQNSYLLSSNKDFDVQDVKDLHYAGYHFEDPLIISFVKSFSPKLSIGNIKIGFSANSHNAIVEHLIENKNKVGVLPYYSKPVESALEEGKIFKVGDYSIRSDLFLLTTVEETLPLRKKVFLEFLLNR